MSCPSFRISCFDYVFTKLPVQPEGQSIWISLLKRSRFPNPLEPYLSARPTISVFDTKSQSINCLRELPALLLLPTRCMYLDNNPFLTKQSHTHTRFMQLPESLQSIADILFLANGTIFIEKNLKDRRSPSFDSDHSCCGLGCRSYALESLSF